MECNEFKKLRESRGLTQKKAAELLGVSIRQIGNLENGLTPIKELYIEKISTFGAQSVNGDHNVVTSGANNVVSTNSGANPHAAELCRLIEQYATPKLIEEIKSKLLKIKEAHE